MSQSNKGCPSCQIGEPSLFNLKVADFLREVCSKYEGDIDKTVDQFFEMLIQILFKFNDLLPVYRMQLNRIIRMLVEYGVQCRYNLDSKKRNSNTNLIHELKNSSSFDHKWVYSELYDLDKKIIEIQELKMQIYNQLFKQKSGCVNVKSEVVDESVIEGNSSKDNEEVFDPECVQRVLQGMLHKKGNKDVKTPQNVNQHNVDQMPQQNLDPERADVPCGQVNKNSNQNITSVVNIKVEDNRFSKHITLNKVSSSVTCMHVYKDSCMVGCENGQLQIFNLESGKLIDNIQAHSKPVTSLVIWNDILISSSLDESLKSFNLKKNSTRRLFIEHPIETTDVSDGILYAGTSTGKIFRFNMLSLTQIGLMFHLSRSRVIFMKVIHNGTKRVILISAEKKPIVIRCAETGILLKTLQVSNIRSFDICGKYKYWFGISENCLYSISLNKPEGNKKILKSNLSKVCLFGELVVVYGNDGKIYLFNQELLLQNTLSVALKGDISAFAIWKQCLITTSTDTRELNMIRLVPE